MRKRVALGSMLVVSAAFAGCARENQAPQLAYVDDTSDTLRTVLESDVEAQGGGGTVQAEPTGWATLAGTFKISGSPPSRSPLNITKDREVCAPGGRQVLDRSIVVGPEDGIKDVLVFVSSRIPDGDAKWIHESYEADREGEVIFDQEDCIFLSRVATMRSTQRLKVLNSDPVGHNTNLSPSRGALPANFTVPAGDSSYYEPGGASPAPFDITCSIHPWMRSNLMVCDHPYFAVTAEDGTFEIPNVPAGVELEFRVWQEEAGFLQTVTVGDQDQEWSKGRFDLTLDPDDRHEMNVVVDSSVFQ